MQRQKQLVGVGGRRGRSAEMPHRQQCRRTGKGGPEQNLWLLQVLLKLPLEASLSEDKGSLPSRC